jgi:MoaA/NifB/PqqE/SkfB family radical SAM enzyme
MEKMYGKITRLHIELSSRCNASCAACSRNFSGGPVVPDLELTSLSLDDIKRMIPIEIVKNLQGINYCGNVGDPGMAPEVLPIMQYFSEHSTKMVQQMRTNGGMRNFKFWTALGEFFVKQPKFSENHLFDQPGVVFSVDGLEDTNHIYRRGVKWEKLIANMRAYSATGATAIWEWLLFEHNKHQVDEANALANELGFVFIIKNPMGFGEYAGRVTPMNVYNKVGQYEYSIWPANVVNKTETPEVGYVVDFNKETLLNMKHKIIPIINEFGKSLEKDNIVCKSIQYKNNGEVYISANGYMLPCCFLGGIFGNFNTSYSRYQFNTLITEYGIDKFNLKNSNMVEIMNGPHFQKFFLDAWKKDTIDNGKLLFCLETCGTKSAIDKLYVKGSNIIEEVVL